MCIADFEFEETDFQDEGQEIGRRLGDSLFVINCAMIGCAVFAIGWAVVALIF